MISGIVSLPTAFDFPYFFGQHRHSFEEVADDSIVGDVEDWGFRIFIYGYYGSGVFHADKVLDGAGNTKGHVKFRRNGLSRRSDLAVDW